MIRRPNTHEFICRLCTGVACLGASTLPTTADLVINPIYLDGAGETWTAPRQTVVEQAISDWTNALGAPGGQTYELDITFQFTQAGTSSYLGRWNGSSSGLFVGDDLLPWNKADHTISFNASYFNTGLDNYSWWDPTPGDAADQPFEAWDLLSVARHEIGHALGYTTFYVYDISTGSESRPWESLITDVGGDPVFDAGGLNIEMAGWTNLGHVADSGTTENDLHTAALPNGTRRDISQTNIDMLTLAYGYQAIPEPNVPVLVMGAGLLLLKRRRFP